MVLFYKSNNISLINSKLAEWEKPLLFSLFDLEKSGIFLRIPLLGINIKNPFKIGGTLFNVIVNRSERKPYFLCDFKYKYNCVFNIEYVFLKTNWDYHNLFKHEDSLKLREFLYWSDKFTGLFFCLKKTKNLNFWNDYYNQDLSDYTLTTGITSFTEYCTIRKNIKFSRFTLKKLKKIFRFFQKRRLKESNNLYVNLLKENKYIYNLLLLKLYDLSFGKLNKKRFNLIKNKFLTVKSKPINLKIYEKYDNLVVPEGYDSVFKTYDSSLKKDLGFKKIDISDFFTKIDFNLSKNFIEIKENTYVYKNMLDFNPKFLKYNKSKYIYNLGEFCKLNTKANLFQFGFERKVIDPLYIYKNNVSSYMLNWIITEFEFEKKIIPTLFLPKYTINKEYFNFMRYISWKKRKWGDLTPVLPNWVFLFLVNGVKFVEKKLNFFWLFNFMNFSRIRCFSIIPSIYTENRYENWVYFKQRKIFKYYHKKRRKYRYRKYWIYLRKPIIFLHYNLLFKNLFYFFKEMFTFVKTDFVFLGQMLNLELLFDFLEVLLFYLIIFLFFYRKLQYEINLCNFLKYKSKFAFGSFKIRAFFYSTSLLIYFVKIYIFFIKLFKIMCNYEKIELQSLAINKYFIDINLQFNLSKYIANSFVFEKSIYSRFDNCLHGQILNYNTKFLHKIHKNDLYFSNFNMLTMNLCNSNTKQQVLFFFKINTQYSHFWTKTFYRIHICLN